MENTTLLVLEGDTFNKWLLSSQWTGFYEKTLNIRLPTTFPATRSHTPEIKKNDHAYVIL